MKHHLFALFTLMCLATVPVQAQTTRDMKTEAAQDFEKAETALNAMFKKVLAKLSPKGAAALEESQRAWLIYREKTAIAYGTGAEGGTLEGLLFVRCKEAITKNRTAELKKIFLSETPPY